MTYTEEEILLIDQYLDLLRKECKVCKKEFPVHEMFFMKEKRIKDGFENKCRKCRGGNYLIKKRNGSPPIINYELAAQFNTISETYEYFMATNVIPYKTFMLDNHLEIFKYLIEKENIQISNLNKLDRQWFQDRKLYSSLLRVYNGSVFQFVVAAYPDSFQAWEFTTVGRSYWQDKDNRIKALKWLIDQLLKDKVINSIEEIPRKVTGVTFEEYSLRTLKDEYYDHIYNAFNEIYPNKFYIWQYIQLPEGYLHNKDNRIKCLKELVEKFLKINIADIPKIFSYEYFNRSNTDYGYRFKNILDEYYDSVFDYVNEAYPNTFNKADFPYMNHYITLDNIKVRSEPERALHHFFMSLNINYKYGDEVGRMKINNITVLPDWYIYKDDKIILVEYYGMLNMNGVDFGYNDKYRMKEKLYNQLCNEDSNYQYIALYKEDMRNDFTGVLDKLSRYGIV